MEDKIGLLGGTFDPIHQGHLALAQAAREAHHLHKVLFIPTAQSPFKSEAQTQTESHHRLKMVQLALQEESHFEAFDFEVKQGGVSYTVDTLEAVKAVYTSAQLYFILGADAFSRFSEWKDPERILDMAALIVAKRPESSLEGMDLSKVSCLELDHPASSSKIRQGIAKGESLPQGWLLQSVLTYIKEHGLYEGSQTCRSS